MKQIYNAKDFGEVLRAERKAQGLTQLELAGFAGVGVTYISQLERGKTSAELDRALRVAATLGLNFYAVKRGADDGA